MILEICFFKLCLSQGLNIFLLELSINISTKQIVYYECDILVSCFLKYKKKQNANVWHTFKEEVPTDA